MAQILEAGMAVCDPYQNIKDLISLQDSVIQVVNPDFEPIGSPRTGVCTYHLDKEIDRVFFFAIGKGLQRAAQAVEEILGDVLTGGMVLLKHGDVYSSSRIKVLHGGHPIPDEHCVKNCKQLVAYLKSLQLTARDLVFTVVGNGVSSLLTLPPEEIPFADIQAVTQVVQIEKGLPTQVLNQIRNQVDLLKGGRITRLIHPAKMVHMFTIDLNEPNAYGVCGYEGHTTHNFWLHTLPDMSTPKIAVDFLKKNECFDLVPKTIVDYLYGPAKEHPVLEKAEFEMMDCRIFGVMPTKHNFLPVVMKKAEKLGYTPHFLMRRTFVEAACTGELLSRIALNVQNESMPFTAPCALVLTGEMLVSVEKASGIGGRNQECALAAATVIAGSKRIVVGAVDTDGTDGPGGRFHEEAWAQGCHCLAGAIVDGSTIPALSRHGVDIRDVLREHATSHALWEIGDGVHATQSISVQDIVVLLIMDHDGEITG